MSILLTNQLVTVTCCECAVPFGIPAYVEVTRRQDQNLFYCPMGHSQYFPKGKSQTQLLKEQVADLAAARDREAQHRQAAEADNLRLRKSHARLARRAKAGVCPCCRRTFVSMARHMKAKHPEYGK
jgi:hypothetical protein